MNVSSITFRANKTDRASFFPARTGVLAAQQSQAHSSVSNTRLDALRLAVGISLQLGTRNEGGACTHMHVTDIGKA